MSASSRVMDTMIKTGGEVRWPRDEETTRRDVIHYSNSTAAAPGQRVQSHYASSSSRSTKSSSEGLSQASLEPSPASPDTSKPAHSASPHGSNPIDSNGSVEHQRSSGPIDIAHSPWNEVKVGCDDSRDAGRNAASFLGGGGWRAVDQWADRHSTSLEYPADQASWSRMNQGHSPSKLRNPGSLGSFEVDSSISTRTLPLHNGDHQASLSRRNSPSVEDFAVLIGDLSPDLREIDVITQFLHPPPWPASHPLASSRALAGRDGQDRIGPSAFKSIKSASIVTDTDTGLSRGWGIAFFTTEADRQRALTEMQGIILTPSSGTSPGRPLQVRIADAKVVSSLAGMTTASSSHSQSVVSRSPKESCSRSLYDQVNGRDSSLRSRPHKDFLQATFAAQTSPTVGRYTTPSPMEIAMQSAQTPSPSTWGIATLPGFPTIPATGASGPVDVGLRSGVALGSSYGGPASLGGTHFTLGPATLPSPSSALDPNNTTVFVGGLSSLISEETLKTFFSPFGHIAYVKIPPGKGCGFVSFLRKVDAERAIERMQGFPIGGSRIRLSWGRSQGEKTQQLAQMQINSLANWASTDGYHSLEGFLSPGQAQQKATYQSYDPSSRARNVHTTGAVGLDGTSTPYGGGGGTGDSATQDFLNRYYAYANGRNQDRDAYALAIKSHERYHRAEEGAGSSPYPVSAHRLSHLSEDDPTYREVTQQRSNRDDDVAALFDRMDIAAGRSGTESSAATAAAYGGDWDLTASTVPGYSFLRANSNAAVYPNYGNHEKGQSPLPLPGAAAIASKRSSPFSSTFALKSPWEDRPSAPASEDPYYQFKEDQKATGGGGGGYFGGSSSGASTWQDHSIAGSSFRSDTTPDSLINAATGTDGTAVGSAGFRPFSPFVKSDQSLEAQPTGSVQQGHPSQHYQ